MSETTGKKASWLELFYDVAYVALVAQLTYLASKNFSSLTDWLDIAIIGYSIFIIWWGTTANRNLQPGETTFDKLFLQLQMVGAFLMSLSMSNVFAGDYLPFFLTLALIRLLQSFMLARMYLLHPDSRPATYNILSGFMVSVVLWAVSAFIPDPYHYVVAFMALAVDVFVPLTRGKGNTRRYLDVVHLHERLGLFLMLVMGESMIVVALSNSAATGSISQPTIVFSGLLLMISLWWLYFEHDDKQLNLRPKNLFLFLHAHGFLYGSIILVSVAYKLILEGDTSLTAISFLLVGALGVAISLLIVRASLHAVCRRTVILVGVLAVFAISLGIGGVLTERVYESVIMVSVLFAIAAIMDHFDLFSEQTTPREDASTHLPRRPGVFDSLRSQ